MAVAASKGHVSRNAFGSPKHPFFEEFRRDIATKNRPKPS
jgi:hypothetical protein